LIDWCLIYSLFVQRLVFNANFSSISAISWREQIFILY